MDIQEIARLHLSREPQGDYLPGTCIWWPDESEIRPCCNRFLRRASRAYPSIVYQHCHRVEHTAQYFGVSYRELHEAVRKESENDRTTLTTVVSRA